MNEQIITVDHKGLSLKVSLLVSKKSNEWLVFLHGIQSNKNIFNDVYEFPLLRSCSILAVDFIGFGNSSKPRNFSYDIKDQAAVIKKIINKFGIQKLHLIGHSLGGMVATLLLSSLKSEVLSFVNLEGNLTYADCGLSKTVSEYNSKDFKETQYSKIKADIKSSSDPSSLLRSQWLEKIPDFVFYKTSKSIVKWSKSEELLKLFSQSKVKKVFIYGSWNKEKISRLPKDIQAIEIADSGHFMLLDNPDQTAKVITEFLIPG